jgi:uncharacterized protein YlxP (DUF503 family)
MCSSLKEKRSYIKPFLTKLGREFNISVAELDLHDSWDESVIGCVYLSNQSAHSQRSLQKIMTWIEKNYPHLYIVTDRIELI